MVANGGEWKKADEPDGRSHYKAAVTRWDPAEGYLTVMINERSSSEKWPQKKNLWRRTWAMAHHSITRAKASFGVFHRHLLRIMQLIISACCGNAHKFIASSKHHRVIKQTLSLASDVALDDIDALISARLARQGKWISSRGGDLAMRLIRHRSQARSRRSSNNKQ